MVKGETNVAGVRAPSGGPAPPTEAKPTGSPSVLRRFLATAPGSRAADFARVEEAAEIVAVHPRTVRRWVETGHVEAAFVGGRYWICRDSLAAFLEKSAER